MTEEWMAWPSAIIACVPPIVATAWYLYPKVRDWWRIWHLHGHTPLTTTTVPSPPTQEMVTIGTPLITDTVGSFGPGLSSPASTPVTCPARRISSHTQIDSSK